MTSVNGTDHCTDGAERTIPLGSTVRYEDDLGELTSTVNEIADDGLLELENGDAIPEDRIIGGADS